MIRLDEIKKLIKYYGLKFEGRHLLMQESNPSNYKRLNLVKKIFSDLGDARIENESFYAKKKKSCLYNNCVAPCCYEFKLKPNLKDTLLTQEDIEEISQEIDMNRINEIGFEKYLEEYNKDQVDILKLSLKELKIVYEYAKGNK